MTLSSTKSGVLQAHEFDGKAIFDLAHDAALRFPNRHNDVDRRPQIRRDFGAIWQDQPGHGIAWGETVVSAIFRQVKDFPVGQPGQLRRELVPLAQRRRDGHRKSVLQDARDVAFVPQRDRRIAFFGVAPRVVQGLCLSVSGGGGNRN